MNLMCQFKVPPTDWKKFVDPAKSKFLSKKLKQEQSSHKKKSKILVEKREIKRKSENKINWQKTT